MFGFLKKEKQEKNDVRFLKAVVSGEAIAIEKVPDEIFSSKAMGDGLAFDASEGLIVAPCDCKVVTMSPDMKHAIGLELSNGMEILIHVGVDTVKLNGEGFEQLAKENTNVTCGTPLLKFDKEIIRKHGLCDYVVFIITEQGSVESYDVCLGNVEKGETVIIQW